jgi:hypothetical protein
MKRKNYKIMKSTPDSVIAAARSDRDQKKSMITALQAELDELNQWLEAVDNLEASAPVVAAPVPAAVPAAADGVTPKRRAGRPRKPRVAVIPDPAPAADPETEVATA